MAAPSAELMLTARYSSVACAYARLSTVSVGGKTVSVGGISASHSLHRRFIQVTQGDLLDFKFLEFLHTILLS